MREENRPSDAAEPGSQYVREHLANERTYLAYLRTTIALMTFGIAINRFSRFLEQSGRLGSNGFFGHTLVRTENLGIGMLVIGAVLLLWAALRYAQIRRQIEARDFRPHTRSIWIITGMVLVAALGGAGWLILS